MMIETRTPTRTHHTHGIRRLAGALTVGSAAYRAKAASRNDFLGHNARHAMTQRLKQQELAVIARRKVRKRSLGWRNLITLSIPNQDGFA